MLMATNADGNKEAKKINVEKLELGEFTFVAINL